MTQRLANWWSYEGEQKPEIMQRPTHRARKIWASANIPWWEDAIAAHWRACRGMRPAPCTVTRAVVWGRASRGEKRGAGRHVWLAPQFLRPGSSWVAARQSAFGEAQVGPGATDVCQSGSWRRGTVDGRRPRPRAVDRTRIRVRGTRRAQTKPQQVQLVRRRKYSAWTFAGMCTQEACAAQHAIILVIGRCHTGAHRRPHFDRRERNKRTTLLSKTG